MKKIIQDIRAYFIETDKPVLLICMLVLSVGIYLNYAFDVNYYINQQSQSQQFIYWYLIFFSSLCLPYCVGYLLYSENTFKNGRFLLLLILAPALFAWKMSAWFFFSFSDQSIENVYWNRVVYWPLKLLVMLGGLMIFWKYFNKENHFYGVGTSGFKPRPYAWMLLIMIPLIAAASTQPDFLKMYPKLQHMIPQHYSLPVWKKLLFELSYGLDFVGIELYFRGFLILAFVQWAGKDAILPMAIFYCTIHFGKPLGECVSSFFGGIILGVVTYHTQTIWGGLIVHLGIAWLMELGGFIGNYYS